MTTGSVNSSTCPVVGHPTRLQIRVPRFTCTNTACATKIFQQQLTFAAPKSKLTTKCTRWILQRLAIDRMSVSAISKSLDIGWDLVNQLAVNATRQLVYADPTHLAGVRVLGSMSTSGNTAAATVHPASSPSSSI